ncbi:hypothetical protein OH76DRAFT_1474418, partial [Lentinus brumalis]
MPLRVPSGRVGYLNVRWTIGEGCCTGGDRDKEHERVRRPMWGPVSRLSGGASPRRRMRVSWNAGFWSRRATNNVVSCVAFWIWLWLLTSVVAPMASCRLRDGFGLATCAPLV